MDPEARPSVDEVHAAVEAVIGGNPMPSLPLSDEALECRRVRELNQSKRLNAPVKKTAAAAPAPKVAVPLDSNSVAARRLAAKRGTAVGTPAQTTLSNSFDVSQKKGSGVSDLLMTEGLEDDAMATVKLAAVSSSAGSAEDLFFNSITSSAASTSTSSGAPPNSFLASFDAFGESSANTSPAPKYDDMFAGFGASSASTAFDSTNEDIPPAAPPASSNSFFGDAAPGFGSTSFQATATFDAFGSDTLTPATSGISSTSASPAATTTTSGLTSSSDLLSLFNQPAQSTPGQASSTSGMTLGMGFRAQEDPFAAAGVVPAHPLSPRPTMQQQPPRPPMNLQPPRGVVPPVPAGLGNYGYSTGGMMAAGPGIKFPQQNQQSMAMPRPLVGKAADPFDNLNILKK